MSCDRAEIAEELLMEISEVQKPSEPHLYRVLWVLGRRCLTYNI